MAMSLLCVRRSSSNFLQSNHCYVWLNEIMHFTNLENAFLVIDPIKSELNGIVYKSSDILFWKYFLHGKPELDIYTRKSNRTFKISAVKLNEKHNSHIAITAILRLRNDKPATK